MRLSITRDQAKGLLGGVKFELTARVELSSEETALIQKYKVDKQVLLKKEIPIPFTGKSVVLDLTIGSLTAGQTFKCNDISEILEYEKNVKESCASLKTYLDVMKHFGGQDVLDF